MKEKLKKFLASLAAVIVAVGMMAGVSGVPVMAAEGNGGSNTITVENAQLGQTYTLYKLFDATTTADRQSSQSGGGTSGIAYNYTLTGEKTLNTTYTYTGTDGKSHTVQGSTWFDIDSAGNVKAREGTSNQSLTTEDFQNWAKKFGTQVGEAKKISGTKAGELTFSNLTDGYYFLTSTMGSLVTVTSVAPNQKVKDKNQSPTVVKNEDVKTSCYAAN